MAAPLKLFHYGIAVLVATADLVTKWWMVTHLELHEPVVVVPGLFNLTLVRNSGVAFGLFQDSDSPFKPFVLSLIAFAAILAIIYYAMKLDPHQAGLRLILSVVMGGILGNFIDRLYNGSVVDFLEVYWRNFHWPTFNLADSAISIGIILLLLDSLRPQCSQAD
jgi:signal peptidase II